jgi:hypothetical protein
MILSIVLQQIRRPTKYVVPSKCFRTNMEAALLCLSQRKPPTMTSPLVIFRDRRETEEETNMALEKCVFWSYLMPKL